MGAIAEIVIGPTGNARCLYTEALDLSALGRLDIVRAGHVEPDERGEWRADLSPVGGPRLGPFPNRSDALAAEARWLRERRLAGPSASGRRRGSPSPRALERRFLMRGVAALILLVVAYLILCAVVSCDRGCSAARAGPIRLPKEHEKEVTREMETVPRTGRRRGARVDLGRLAGREPG